MSVQGVATYHGTAVHAHGEPNPVGHQGKNDNGPALSHTVGEKGKSQKRDANQVDGLGPDAVNQPSVKRADETGHCHTNKVDKSQLGVSRTKSYLFITSVTILEN